MVGVGGCHGHPACGHLVSPGGQLLGGCGLSPDGRGQPAGPGRGSSVLVVGWGIDGVADKG